MMRGLFGTLSREVKSLSVDEANPFLRGVWAGVKSRSGPSVNIDTALQTTTVLACTRVLAEGCGQLPADVYTIDQTGRKRTPDYGDVYRLLALRPNEWMTPFEFRETLTMHAVLTHGGFAYIGRGLKDVPVELIPLVPGNVEVCQTPDWKLSIRYTDTKGTMELPWKDVLHIRGPSWNGFRGLEALRLAREAIGLSIATEATHAALHKNGAQPGGILTVKGRIDKPARERLKEAWETLHGDIYSRFKTAVLDVDATWTPLSMKGVDAEHIATREHQIDEICRAMRVFPQMVMHTHKTQTFASAESFFQAHVTHSLMPWLVRWEQALHRDLLNCAPDKRVKLNANALLRGDATQRAGFYEKALGGARPETAYMVKNEVRALEDLDPIEGGDSFPAPAAPTKDGTVSGSGN